MSKVKALLMAIILIVGGLYVWRIEQQEKKDFKQEQESRKIFPQITEDNVKLISATTNSGTFRVFRTGYKENKETTSKVWLLHSPNNALADINKVRDIIFSLLNLESKNVIQKNELIEDQSEYGLIPPELVLTFEGTFGKKVFSFGKKVEATSRRYMQPQDDERIFLVDDTAFKNLDISAEDLCDKKPIKVVSSEIKQVIFVADENNFLKIELDPVTNLWTIANKYKKLTPDQKLIKAKLGALSGLTAKHVIDATEEKLSIYGLKKPILTVAIIDNLENQFTFQIGDGISIDALNLNPEEMAKKNSLAVERAYFLRILGSTVVYQLKHSYFADFLQDINFFRSKTPFIALSINNLENFNVEINKKTFSLLERSEAKSLLAAINNLRIISYSNLNEVEKGEFLGKSISAIELKIKNKEIKYKIFLGPKIRDNSNDDQSPYWIYINTDDGETLAAVISVFDYNEILKIIEHLQ